MAVAEAAHALAAPKEAEGITKRWPIRSLLTHNNRSNFCQAFSTCKCPQPSERPYPCYETELARKQG